MSELGERVVGIEQRRLVVDEVGVEPTAVEQHPRAHRVRRLVNVQDLDNERQPACQQARAEIESQEAGDERVF